MKTGNATRSVTRSSFASAAGGFVSVATRVAAGAKLGERQAPRPAPTSR